VTYNFSSGPATLPDAVIAAIRNDLPSWRGTGQPLMTLSHRGADFIELMAVVKAKLRQALAIPDSHDILILQGGGMGQFAAVPLNLTHPGDKVSFLLTGNWGVQAAKEAGNYQLCVDRPADQQSGNYTTLPPLENLAIDPASAYLHYVPNETIQGVEFSTPPVTVVPLVADASSQILSRPMDVGAHGVIFAGTQKNLGVAGAVVVIIDRALLGRARLETPSILDYTKMSQADSLLNTPTTFAVYVLDLMLDWVARLGGVEAMAVESRAKADLVYAAIDASDFYRNPVEQSARSTKNIPFTMADPSLDRQFLAEAEAAGLMFLEGHRSVGGMRASLYNAMPQVGVVTLVDFIKDFERRNG
jgi:phosphoserine aminotransferase